MRRNRPIHCGSLLLMLLIGSAAGPSGAEAVCQEPGEAIDRDCRYLLLPGTTAGVTEEPDPINVGSQAHAVSSPWGALAAAATGMDSAQIVSANGVTVAAWVSTIGGVRDIIFGEWRADGWHEEFLTLGGSDQLDPGIAIGHDGAVYVSWWETAEPRRVRTARRDPATLAWDQPATLSGMYGGRPSILTLPGGGVLIAFERRGFSGGQEVVIRRTGIAGGPVEEVLARTSRVASLAIQLHLQGSRPYIDWIHADGQYGYSELINGQWGASPDSRPLTQRAGLRGTRIGLLPPLD